jgi:isopenicillin N synthase-like dioxygenase
VIDLALSFSPDRAARADVAWKIHQACRATGFFYVSNHGVAPDRPRRCATCTAAEHKYEMFRRPYGFVPEG